jgi:glycosyltransferase involved in cell wall biosynthesis
LYQKSHQILVLTETYYPEIGGGESQARNLSEALAAKGYQVILATRRSRVSLPYSEEAGSARIVRLPPSGSGQFKKWGMLLPLVLFLLSNRREFDLVFVSGFRILGIVAVPVSRLLGKPCVLKADSLGEMSGRFFGPGLARIGLGSGGIPFRILLWLRNSVLRRAACHVAISQAIRIELTSAGIDPVRIRDIPNCVDIERYSPVSLVRKRELRQMLDLPEGVPLVIYTGRLVTYKGLFTLLRVWKTIHGRHQGVELLLVGSGGLDIHDCEEQLREFARREFPLGSVRFTGSVHNVHEYLQASDIFVLPTENEAFGLSLVEAMACGLAVISTDVGGVADIIQHRKTGITVPASNDEGLQTALNELLRDRKLRHQLGISAHKTALERFSVSRVTSEYENLFAELLAKPTRSAHL